MDTGFKTNILVVDDDRDIVKAIATLLEKEGYHIFKAYDGLEALDVIMSNDIHLMLIDVMMPRMDGLSAIMRIRQTKNIPIIVLSAKSEDTDKVLGLSVGADDYISKPYRVFQNIIDNALKYSMPGTRIYLNADIEGAEFVVTLKNVSEYEMDFTAEEVMSRFTRGDKSRHSEGNGLGLSIAKSFTELMGGTFTVEIDDDVFKAIVSLML